MSQTSPHIPKYQRVAHVIFTDMVEQGLSLAKPQRTLAEQFGVNRLTIQRALGWLEQQGKLERLPNQGHTLGRQWQQPQLTDSGRPKIGYPLWIDSFAQIDAFNTMGRMKIIEAAHNELQRLGYELDIQCVGSPLALQQDKIDRLSRQWSGILLEPMEGESTLAEDHPFSALFDYAAMIGAINNWRNNCVCPDFYHATELAVQSLLRSGAKRILYTGREEETISHLFLRLVGLEKPINRNNAGGKAVELLFAGGNFNSASAFSATKQFFLDGGSCDAIVAASAPAAMGAARALADLRLRMPQDVQLISIGTSEALGYMVPRPTSVEISGGMTIGREAARMVVERIRSGGRSQATVMIPMQLTNGETTFTGQEHTPLQGALPAGKSAGGRVVVASKKDGSPALSRR